VIGGTMIAREVEDVEMVSVTSAWFRHLEDQLIVRVLYDEHPHDMYCHIMILTKDNNKHYAIEFRQNIYHPRAKDDTSLEIKSFEQKNRVEIVEEMFNLMEDAENDFIDKKPVLCLHRTWNGPASDHTSMQENMGVNIYAQFSSCYTLLKFLYQEDETPDLQETLTKMAGILKSQKHNFYKVSQLF
jgi:hypothetical protein